ncbi:MAG: iron-containing alcohol dehydrogenase [Spirochaetia bacterium]|nr:iron-containing alcohol dehydrogenase [Spirochaetia bacterium]MCF7941745.1 iron-containing alcohol dehydrogenase [Spirochaetia bacterium]
MDQYLSFDFFARPRIISGSKALEAIVGELEHLGIQSPLILWYAGRSSSQLQALKKALGESPAAAAAVCRMGDHPSRSEFKEILTLMSSSGCDALLVLGSGSIQSTAKLLNLMYSRSVDIEQLPELPESREPLLPHIAILDEQTDGREAACRLLVDEFRLSDPAIYPDTIVIDERICGSCTMRELADSAIISLAQICECYRAHTSSPMIKAWTNPALRFLGDHQSRSTGKKARAAHLNAAVYAQIAHSTVGFGPISTLAELFEVSQFCSAAELTAVVLPYYIRELEETRSTLFTEVFREISTLSSAEADRSFRQHESLAQALTALAAANEERASTTGKRPIIESMIRQTRRLLSADDQHELLTLLDTIVTHTAAQTARGGLI